MLVDNSLETPLSWDECISCFVWTKANLADYLSLVLLITPPRLWYSIFCLTFCFDMVQLGPLGSLSPGCGLLDPWGASVQAVVCWKFISFLQLYIHLHGIAIKGYKMEVSATI